MEGLNRLHKVRENFAMSAKPTVTMAIFIHMPSMYRLGRFLPMPAWVSVPVSEEAQSPPGCHRPSHHIECSYRRPHQFLQGRPDSPGSQALTGRNARSSLAAMIETVSCSNMTFWG